MVYFGKKQGQTPAGSATLAGNNTFTGTNTFNNPVVIPEPTQDSEAANKKYVDDLNDQIEQEINAMPKLGLDNTFTGNNTFNNPLNVGTNGFKTTQTNFTIVEQVNQSGKQINIDFNQPSGTFKNYCSLAVRYKYQSQNYVELIKFENRPDNNEGVYISTPLNKFDFANKEITSVANPTTNTSATNKQYVDNRVKTAEKTGITFTRQQQPFALSANKYWKDITYADLGVPDGKTIISICIKSRGTTTGHQIFNYITNQATNTVGLEIYDYFQSNQQSSNITTALQSMVFTITYIN